MGGERRQWVRLSLLIAYLPSLAAPFLLEFVPDMRTLQLEIVY